MGLAALQNPGHPRHHQAAATTDGSAASAVDAGEGVGEEKWRGRAGRIGGEEEEGKVLEGEGAEGGSEAELEGGKAGKAEWEEEEGAAEDPGGEGGKPEEEEEEEGQTVKQ